jgi:hypothetical protein
MQLPEHINLLALSSLNFLSCLPLVMQAAMSLGQPIFCCPLAVPVKPSNSNKLHNNPNREIHDAIFRSFLTFAVRRQRSTALMALLLGMDPGAAIIPSPPATPLPPKPVVPAPVITPEELKDNPLKPQTPYVIHLTSRHDFGLVYSHRYFVCPSSLQEDWIEITLEQWFSAGGEFKLKAEKWDLKCVADARFFRITLRPNLAMRCFLAQTGSSAETFLDSCG